MTYEYSMQFAAGLEDKVFKALADPSRRAIFESLTRGEAAVTDLTARFDISQPAVSQHLAALRDAGLVNGRREGRWRYYRVEPRGMQPLVEWMTQYRAFCTEHVGRLEQPLGRMDQCPSPTRPQNRKLSPFHSNSICIIRRERCGAPSPSPYCSRSGSCPSTVSSS